MPPCKLFASQVRVTIIALAAIVLATSATAQNQPQKQDSLSKNVAICLKQARAELGETMGNQEKRIDAYAANGRILFYNPFVNQGPTFAFWKCLRLKDYQVDG
jgi:hypothetical protein